MNLPRLLLPVLVACSGLTFAQSPSTPQKSTSAQVADNEVLKGIVQRDQAIRSPESAKAAPHGEETDEDRRKLIHDLIARDELHTGLDYANAALVFQHGSTPDDYLLAHVLAVIGASKGDRLALWLTAATLDRYLQSIKQDQIYGTQFTRKPPGPFGFGQMNATLLTDRIRQENGVPKLADQEQQLKNLNRRFASEAAKP